MFFVLSIVHSSFNTKHDGDHTSGRFRTFLSLSAAKIFGGVLIRNPSAAWRQRNNMSLEILDRRKTTFVYHFLVNEIDI